MIHYFGSVNCEHCQKKNRVLLEQNFPTEHFLVIGDSVLNEIKIDHSEVTCEYCFKTYTAHPLEKDGVLSVFANGKELEDYEQEPTKLVKAEIGQGMKQEEKLEKQFKQLYTFPFEQQPFDKSRTLYLLDEKWTIENIYKKEHTEQNYEKRMEIDFFDVYYYEIKNDLGEYKWLEVVDDLVDNASMSDENPVVLKHETLYNINDSGFKSVLVFEQQLGVQYEIKAYQHLSGVQMLVIRKEEDNEKVVVLDLLGESVEELFLEVEEWLNVTE